MLQRNKDGSTSEVGWTVADRLKPTGQHARDRLLCEQLRLHAFDTEPTERRLMQMLIGSDIHGGEQ